MRVNAAVGRRGVKGLRGKGRILFGKAKCAPRLRDALTRGMWNLRKGNFEKRSCIEILADLA
jgi:hypothetical protein